MKIRSLYNYRITCKCGICTNNLILYCICTCICTAGAEHGVQLEITTDPPGPVYMASSWIRFACKATNHSSPETLHYKWIGFSNSVQGAQTLLVDDPLLDGDHSALIWLLSTSDVQYVECRLFNNTGILQSTGLDIAVTGRRLVLYVHISRSA